MKRTKLFADALRAFFVVVWTIATTTAFAAADDAPQFRRARPTLDDAFAATCRVTVDGARGSGTFVGVDPANPNVAKILTNFHVVGKTNVDATLDFWSNSIRQSIRGKVSWRYYDENMPADYATIDVDAAELKKIDPPFVPFAGPGTRPSKNAFIVSAGCPDGRFTQAWRGVVVDYYNDKTTVFSPPPVPGQSGSGIFEIIDGDLYYTATLTWLFGTKGSDESNGGAIPIANLYLAVSRSTPTATPNALPATPPGAVECATTSEVVCKTDGLAVASEANRVALLAFFYEPCKPCEMVKPQTRRLIDEGFRVESTLSSARDTSFAQRWGVANFPAFKLIRYNGSQSAAVCICDVDASNVYESAKSAFAKEFDNIVARNSRCSVVPAVDVKNVEDDAEPFVVINSDFKVADFDAEDAKSAAADESKDEQKDESKDERKNETESEQKTESKTESKTETKSEQESEPTAPQRLATDPDEPPIERPDDKPLPDAYRIEGVYSDEPTRPLFASTKSESELVESPNDATEYRFRPLTTTENELVERPNDAEQYRFRAPTRAGNDPSGLLDDARRRWDERGRKDDENEKTPDDADDESQVGGIGTRLVERLANRFERSVDEKIAAEKTRLATAIQTTARRWAFGAFFAVVLAVVVGNFSTSIARGTSSFCCRKFVAMKENAQAKIEAFERFQAQMKKTNEDESEKTR